MNPGSIPSLGVEVVHEAFYIEGMLFNARTAVASLQHANSLLVLAGGKEEIPPDMQDEILNNIQNIILHAAALSRYFWPIRKNDNLHKERGTHLRDKFSINDDSPLKHKTLRDHLEHFDEKLDKHLKGGIVGYVLPKYVGPSLSDNEPPHHLFRAYFVDTAVFQVLNEKHEIGPLVEEIYRIYDLLLERAR